MAESFQHITDKNLKSRELWGNETERKTKLDAMKPDDFNKWLISLNANLRKLNPSLHEFDGEGVVVGDDDVLDVEGVVVAHQPPDQQDKVDLLEYMLKSAQNLPNIQDSALLIAAGINQIHPFRDGNGRTSRLIYANLSAGSKFVKDHIKEIGSGRSNIDIGSFIPHKFLYKVAKERLGENASDRELRAEAVRVLCDGFSDSSIVLKEEDIPYGMHKRAAVQGLSLADYFRMASLNLVSSEVRYGGFIDNPKDEGLVKDPNKVHKDDRFKKSK